MREDRQLYTFGQNIELLKQLNAHGISYLLVGGLAVSWYCPSRQAQDMDLLIDPNPVNADKLEKILSQWGIVSSRLDGPHRLLVLKSIHYADLLTPPAEWPKYEEISMCAGTCRVAGEVVPVVSIRNLIRLKEIACVAQLDNSEKHMSDINTLKAVLLSSHQIE
jgi:hypothetical protein